MCQVAMDYILTGHAKVVEDKIRLPNGQVVPNDGTGRGIQASIDLWLTSQTPPVPAQTHIVYMPSPPPEQHAAPPTQIEEVAKANILQITEVQPQVQEQCEDEDLDIFQVFAAEKKKCDNRAAKIPELANPPQEDKSPAATPYAKPAPQYRYHSNAEDQQLISELHSWLMEGKLSLTTSAHILAASPSIWKELVERLKVRRVEANTYEEVHNISHEGTPVPSPTAWREPKHSLPLLELDVLVGECITVPGVLDPGSQIVVIRRDLANKVNVRINTNHLVQMEGANGATNWTVGCAEYLTMQVSGVPFKIHAHVVDDAPFKLLLGRPFGQAVSSTIDDLPSGETEVYVWDPANLSRRIYIPTRPRKGRVTSVKILAVVNSHTDSDGSVDSHLLEEDDSCLPNHSRCMRDIASAPHPFPPLLPSDTNAFSFAYKKVANKV
jgi:hypothetical protein